MIWVVLLVSVLFALLFVLWPALRAQGKRQDMAAAADPHDQVVLHLYEQRIGELDKEVDDHHVRAQMQDELGAVLLSEVTDGIDESDARERTGVQADRLPLGQTVGSVMFVPVLALALFFWISDPGVTRVQGAEALMALSAEEDEAALQDWRSRLRTRVETATDDHKSWYLLGHSELKLGDYPAAANAFANANELVEDDLTLLVYWLQARYLAAQGELDSVSRGIAERILRENPDVPVVLEMLAVDAFQRQQYESAISLLNRAISGSQNPAQQASFAVAIRQVRAALSVPPAGVEVVASSTAQVPHNATLFVLARPVGGGMPYAVVKRPAALLPLTVQLDDLVSMSPDRLLSSAEEFEVVVRISRSGTAMPAADDWQWVSAVQTLVDTGSIKLEAQLSPPT
ncbi:MAG: c-type cytochrome biogenesis protein CcmI [Pseudomonadota bacterium]